MMSSPALPVPWDGVKGLVLYLGGRPHPLPPRRDCVAVLVGGCHVVVDV